VLKSRADEIEKNYGGIASMSRIMAQLCESIKSNASFIDREQAAGTVNKAELWEIKNEQATGF
jgi:hypothetical protein